MGYLLLAADGHYSLGASLCKAAASLRFARLLDRLASAAAWPMTAQGSKPAERNPFVAVEHGQSAAGLCRSTPVSPTFAAGRECLPEALLRSGGDVGVNS